MFHFAARTRTPALRLARSIRIKAPGYGSPEAEGPLYTHAAAVVQGIRTSGAGDKPKPTKQRDPKSKNLKVAGGTNFVELRKMHNVSQYWLAAS
jgi:hypothetical protein